jgi:hypothetical protein
MKLLMLVLHGKRTSEIEEIESTDLLAEISLLIRKYGLVGKMGYLLDYVRLKQQSLSNFDHCSAWFTALLIAHPHGDSSTFRNMSRLLILNHESGFSDLIDRSFSDAAGLSKDDIQSVYKTASKFSSMLDVVEWYKANQAPVMLDHARSQVEWQLQAMLLRDFSNIEGKLQYESKIEPTFFYSETPSRALLYALDNIGLYFPRMTPDTLPRPSITDILVKFYERDICQINQNRDSIGRSKHAKLPGVAIQVIERLLQNVRGVCMNCYNKYGETFTFGCEHDADHELCFNNVRVKEASSFSFF